VVTANGAGASKVRSALRGHAGERANEIRRPSLLSGASQQLRPIVRCRHRSTFVGSFRVRSLDLGGILMPQRRHVARAALTAAAATACLALGSPALAADPAGANGTVKIDGPAYQEDNRNEPHVSCEFQVEFFNFDKGERATLIFEAWPPSAPDFHEVKRLENVLVSDDESSGGAYHRDADEVFRFSAAGLNLTAAMAHPQQGYHIKLTIDRQNHPGWTEKHKVFWLKACDSSESPSPSASPTPSGSQSSTPGSPENPSASPSGPAGGGTGGGGGLPITGAAATSMALTGVVLIGGGVALMTLRRRRDKVRFTS
jgi:LPXTG-motif cell wall-anchored protein